MCTVTNVALFYSSLMSCLLVVLGRYFLNDFGWFQLPLLLPVARFNSTRHVFLLLKSIYFRIFPASFLITILLYETATYINNNNYNYNYYYYYCLLLTPVPLQIVLRRNSSCRDRSALIGVVLELYVKKYI